MALRKRYTIGSIFILLVIAACFRHYTYIYNLSPLLKNVVTHESEYPHLARYSLDAKQGVEKYIHVGMSKNEVDSLIASSGLTLIDNAPRRSTEIKQYDSSVFAYAYLRAGFAGWRALMAGSYTLSIQFNFNDNVLQNYSAALLINTL